MPRDASEAQIISDELGFTTASIMCEIWGGRTLYVPNTPSPSHPIAKDLDFNRLTELCDVMGGQTITLPRLVCLKLTKQRRKAQKMAAFGMSQTDIAETLEVTTETVRAWLK